MSFFFRLSKNSLRFQYEVNFTMTNRIFPRTIFPRRWEWLILLGFSATPMVFPWSMIKLVVSSSRDSGTFKNTLRLFRREYCSYSSNSFSTFSLSSAFSDFMSLITVFGSEISLCKFAILSSRILSSLDIASTTIDWKTVLSLASLRRERNESTSRDIFSFWWTVAERAKVLGKAQLLRKFFWRL